MGDRVVLLLDGGFVKKKLQQSFGHFLTVSEVVAMCNSVTAKPQLLGKDLFRIYFYDAPPFTGTVTNPISQIQQNLSATPQAIQNAALIDSLELQPDFAVRRGMLKCSGWKLGRAALARLNHPGVHQVNANDLVPNINQKGVDMRIGLDMAWIALKRLAEILVLITGDSDFVPVMKFARREGMRVLLEHLGHPVSRDLKAHADQVL
jgi:uncharacterized LabA/DUF88 family protein